MPPRHARPRPERRGALPPPHRGCAAACGAIRRGRQQRQEGLVAWGLPHLPWALRRQWRCQGRPHVRPPLPRASPPRCYCSPHALLPVAAEMLPPSTVAVLPPPHHPPSSIDRSSNLDLDKVRRQQTRPKREHDLAKQLFNLMPKKGIVTKTWRRWLYLS